VSLVEELTTTSIGSTFNFYRDGDGADVRRTRLRDYLEAKADAPLLLVGEAPGYRGTRISGVPLTSEQQVSGSGPREATATIVHRVLAALALDDEALLWNVVPTHPHLPGRPATNRRPTRIEVEASRRFLERLVPGRRVVAVGRLAHVVLGREYVRHPSHGGAAEFCEGLRRIVGANAKEAPNMDEIRVREHAEAHGQAVEAGDLKRAGSDVADEFQPHLREVMSRMPRPVTAADLMSVDPAGDDEYFSTIRYSGGDKATTLKARWAERENRPMIVDIQVVE
jgi:uracil-DNA glycosylase